MFKAIEVGAATDFLMIGLPEMYIILDHYWHYNVTLPCPLLMHKQIIVCPT